MQEDVPVSPPRVVIRCAKRGEYTAGPGEHIINVSSIACEEAEIDMPLDISSVRRAPPTEWPNPLWEAVDEITSWAEASGSVVILCDTGADTSRLVASIVGSILRGCGANVTTCPPPESDARWLMEMYNISQNFIGIDEMEEELFWVLNGSPSASEPISTEPIIDDPIFH